MINKRDILLMGAVAFIAVLALGAVHFLNNGGTQVVITRNGEVYGTYDLSENQVICLDGEDGTNTVKIQDGSVSMIEASCPDQICVHSYPLTADQPGMIVCLPHQVVVELKEE